MEIQQASSIDECIKLLKKISRIPPESLELLKDASKVNKTNECFQICVDGLTKVLEKKYKWIIAICVNGY